VQLDGARNVVVKGPTTVMFEPSCASGYRRRQTIKTRRLLARGRQSSWLRRWNGNDRKFARMEGLGRAPSQRRNFRRIGCRGGARLSLTVLDARAHSLVEFSVGSGGGAGAVSKLVQERATRQQSLVRGPCRPKTCCS